MGDGTAGEGTAGHGAAGDGAGGVGRVLAGRYRITGQLGRGGMGVVWRAVDNVLGREVAVKELRTYTDAGSSELDDLRTRMQREARAAARVRHPGVVAVHDVAQHEGRPVIVMELVEGPSLDDVLRERGTLEPREAAAIGAKVMDALAAAHQAGVLHRDVKPGNVLLEQGGERVVLTDFGIAAMEDPGDGASTHLTGSGELVGSLDYLAPERARGEQPRPASDVWALGATLYAAVEGAAPFRRTSTWSTLTAIVADPLPEPRRAGPLAPALAELMDKDPGQRADAARATALLEAVAAGKAPPAASGTMLLGHAGGPAAPPSGVPKPPGEPAQSTEPSSHGAAHAGPPPGPGPSDPPLQHPGVQGQYGGQQAAPGAYGAHQAHGRPETDTDRHTVRTRAARTRSRALVAAAVAAVVLAGAGVTYAVVGQGGENNGARADGGSGTGSAASGSQQQDGKGAGGKSQDGDRYPSGRDDDKTGPGAAAGNSSGGDDGKVTQGGGGSQGADGGTGGLDSGGSAPGAGGGTGGADGGGGSATGGADASGGGAPGPLPVCNAKGGGKFDCSVWKTATSYNGAHKPVGKLNAGTNYFFCQKKLAHRETSGRWTNVWWAKTDDDSGNAKVFVSVVYIRGGNNNEPVPGLPTC